MKQQSADRHVALNTFTHYSDTKTSPRN